MLHLLEEVRVVCQKRRASHACGEQRQMEGATPSLEVLLRRVRAAAGLPRPARAAVAAPPGKPVLQHGEASLERPVPFLYPTPDGALRPALAQHRRLQATAPCSTCPHTDAHVPPPMTNVSQGWRVEKKSSQGANKVVMDRGNDVSVPSHDNPNNDRKAVEDVEEMQRQQPIAMVLDIKLIEELMSLCTSATHVGERAENIFSFAESVEALYTLVYLTCVPCGNHGLKKLVAEGETDSLSPKWRINFLQLATTACNMLKQVVEQLAEYERGGTTAKEKSHLLCCFVTIANTIIILLGCQSPHHWEKDVNDKGDLHIDACSKVAFSLQQQLVERESGCCLCYTTNPPLCDLMVAALTEHGLWQCLWRVILFPSLTQLQQRQEKQQQRNGEEPVALDEVDGGSKHRSAECILGVRLTLKMMTLLLLRVSSWSSAAAAEEEEEEEEEEAVEIPSSVLCLPTSEEEEALEAMWQQPLAVTGSPSDRPQLSLLEKSLLYTLRRLSGFLVFRCVSCYAANAMHVLLTRLLVLPAAAGVNVQAVFVGLFFLKECSPSPNATAASSVASPFSCDGEVGTDVGGAVSMPTMTLVLGRILHLLSFRLAVKCGESRRPVPKRSANHAATTIISGLVVPAAMLTAVLLLGQKDPQQQEWLELMIVRHKMYKACEDSPWLQDALAAGLSRTHQVILLLCTLTKEKGGSISPPSTLLLEGSYVTAFSRLVRPNPPIPLALRRKQVESTTWAETLSITMRSTASIAAVASTSRRKKSQTSFSCTLTCPVQPATMKQGHDSAEMWQQPAGRHDVVQVYVKTPHSEEAAGVDDDGGSGGCASKAVPLLSQEESLPPMVFSYEPVTFSGGAGGGSVTMTSTSPSRRRLCAVETIFACRDGTEYACVTRNPRCLSSLQRKMVEYTAAVDMTLVATPRDCEEHVEGEESPFNAVIVACSTLHGDELQMWLQPPRRYRALQSEEHNNSFRELRRSESSRRQGRQGMVMPRWREKSSSPSPKPGSVLLCSLSRYRAGDPVTKVTAGLTPPQLVAGPQHLLAGGGSSPREETRSQCLNDGSLVDRMGRSSNNSSSTAGSEGLADVDAYVSSLKPVPLVDIALERKDQEIALLQQQLEQAISRETLFERRLQEALAQRENLTRCLADRCAEVQLCHTDIIAPLRREVTRLRHSLRLRNEEVSVAISLCCKLRGENESMAMCIHDIRCDVENMAQTSVGRE